jgi:hypothetical protein
MVKSEKGGLLHGLGYAMGIGRGRTQLILGHLSGTDMSYRSK